jgi:hypothetical protein
MNCCGYLQQPLVLPLLPLGSWLAQAQQQQRSVVALPLLVVLRVTAVLIALRQCGLRCLMGVM